MRLDKQLEATRLDALQRLVSSTSQAIQALFGESKGVAIAEATINTFLAMTKARSMYAPPIGGILAAAELASGIATIANIAKTEIGSSTLSGGGGASSSAFGVQGVEGEQRFRTPQYRPTRTEDAMGSQTNVQIMADRKQLYALVNKGQQEYNGIKTRTTATS